MPSPVQHNQAQGLSPRTPGGGPGDPPPHPHPGCGTPPRASVPGRAPGAGTVRAPPGTPPGTPGPIPVDGRPRPGHGTPPRDPPRPEPIRRTTRTPNPAERAVTLLTWWPRPRARDPAPGLRSGQGARSRYGPGPARHAAWHTGSRPGGGTAPPRRPAAGGAVPRAGEQRAAAHRGRGPRASRSSGARASSGSRAGRTSGRRGPSSRGPRARRRGGVASGHGRPAGAEPSDGRRGPGAEPMVREGAGWGTISPPMTDRPGAGQSPAPRAAAGSGAGPGRVSVPRS